MKFWEEKCTLAEKDIDKKKAELIKANHQILEQINLMNKMKEQMTETRNVNSMFI